MSQKTNLPIQSLGFSVCREAAGGQPLVDETGHPRTLQKRSGVFIWKLMTQKSYLKITLIQASLAHGELKANLARLLELNRLAAGRVSD